MNYKQTEQDLKRLLAEQIEFMQRSAKSFDSGYSAEGKRLALHIRVLLHDTGASKSLLTQLGKKGILFYDTSLDYNPRNLLSFAGLIMMQMGEAGTGYIAPLDNGSPPRYRRGKIPFDEWWNKIVFLDTKGNKLTRRDLVKAVCNKDGGAHVDPELDHAYAKLTKENALGWVFNIGGKETESATPPELASIRQIAHEVLKSLRDEFPDSF